MPLEPDHANETVGEDRVDKALDAALQMTFPASDPVALFIPSTIDASPGVQLDVPGFPLRTPSALHASPLL
jgi:hypothetical protein